MPLEIEERFQNFDFEEIKRIFKANNILKMGGSLLKNSNYYGTNPNQFIRVRDEGNKITFTIKQRNNNGYDTEYEVVVDNYDVINTMLLQLQLKKKNDMHKYREIYMTPDKRNEIIFDYNPGLPPYMEIESMSETDLHNTMKLLGLSKEPMFVQKDLYYKYYGIKKNREMVSLTFENAYDILGNLITKNKEQFDDILNKQIKLFIK